MCCVVSKLGALLWRPAVFPMGSQPVNLSHASMQVRGLAHPGHWSGPLGPFFEQFGAVKAGPFTAHRLLRQGEQVLLFPGKTRGGRGGGRAPCHILRKGVLGGEVAAGGGGGASAAVPRQDGGGGGTGGRGAGGLTYYQHVRG